MLSTQLQQKLHTLIGQRIEAPQNQCGDEHDHQADYGVVCRLLRRRPHDLFELALHVAEPFADAFEKRVFFIDFLDGFGGSFFLFRFLK